MDYQQEQFGIESEQGVFGRDKSAEIAVNRDNRAIGERFLDLNSKSVESMSPEIDSTGKVEMLTPTDMGLVKPDVSVDDGTNGKTIDFSLIKNGSSDRLDDKAVEQVVACEKEFIRDGNTERFYDKVVEMKKALLANNYGREIGEKVA